MILVKTVGTASKYQHKYLHENLSVSYFSRKDVVILKGENSLPLFKLQTATKQHLDWFLETIAILLSGLSVGSLSHKDNWWTLLEESLFGTM